MRILRKNGTQPERGNMDSEIWSGSSPVSTGVAGLDQVLFGGLPPRAMHFLQGNPGTGKTTLALQFLIDGAAKGEKGLFITISQSEADLRRIARSHGMSLDLLDIEELSPLDLARDVAERQTVLQTAEVELARTMEHIRELLARSKADRIVFDSLFEFRLLAGNHLSYRRNLLLLKSLVLQSGATALFLDYADRELGDRQLEALAHGVIELSMRVPTYGKTHRQLCVAKMRGHRFIEGNHDVTIRTGGLTIFPRIVPDLHEASPASGIVGSGLSAVDEMLGGGLEEGTTCLIVGQAGTGKSTLATAYADHGARSGRSTAMFLFEERPEIFRRRSRDLGFHLEEREKAGTLTLQHFNPAETSPGEFAQAVVTSVEDRGARVVVIDSLTGYLGAMPEERDLITQLHSLLAYLSRRGVLTILIVAQHGVLGGPQSMDIDTSYLSDTAILLRYEQAGTDIRRTITIVKKRHGDHETAVRELDIGDGSVDVRPLAT
ncbi:ATPase domain-containing protein [Fulvimarina manganoxydans]